MYFGVTKLVDTGSNVPFRLGPNTWNFMKKNENLIVDAE